MTTVAFTASRDMDASAHASVVDGYLRELIHMAHIGVIDEFVTGAARGGDTIIARVLEQACPATLHRIVVPAAPHNEGLVSLWEMWAENTPGTHVVERMVKGPGAAPAQYRRRDQRMVDLAKAGGGWLEAFPLHEERRQPRSGTWLTVRLARKSEVEQRVHIMDPLPTLLD